MKFSEIKPSIQLRQFIQCFWLMELDCVNAQSELRERVIPDGSTEIIFHLGENVSRIKDQGVLLSEPNSLLIGQNTYSYLIAAKGRVKMFGIKFLPHTVSFLTQESASQFNNKTIDLTDIFGNQVRILHEQLINAKKLSTQVLLAKNFLIDNFQKQKRLHFNYLDFAIQQIILEKGQGNFSEIVQKIGVSARYLEKLFLEYVGILPKTFSQIVQLQNSLRFLSFDSQMSLTEISYACGYFDQSHFIRSIKRFTGLTPTQLLKEKMTMQQPFFASISE